VISFRFHLVSITAVFLGIAIGIVVGSTFVDRAIVDNLRDRIDTVSENLDRRRAENDDLQSENDRLDEILSAEAPYAVSGRLSGTPVLVLAVRGIDDDAVARVVELARQAGAEAPGILWVEPSWALAESGQADQLAELANVGSGEEDRVRARAWAALVDELVGPPESGGPTTTTSTSLPPDGTTSTPTTEVEPVSTEVLDAVTDSPFLSFEAVGDDAALAALGGRNPSVIAITGTRAEEALAPLLDPLVAALVDAGLRTVVAEIFVEPGEDAVDPPERGDAVRASVPEDIAASVATADHLDRPEGPVAAVLALADLHRDVVGRYGYGDGTAGPMPAWTALTPAG
jgi:hypothetical protein